MDGIGSHERDSGRRVSRRDFVKAAGASGLAVGLAGCTAGGSETNSNTVQWYAGPDEADNGADLKKLLYKAGLSKDIKLEILPGPSNTDTKQQQLQRWLDAKLENPDIILMDSGWAIPFIIRDQVLNLTESEAIPDSLVKKVENGYFEAAVQTATHPLTGDLYGVPLYPDYPTMIYRQDLIEQAGYDPQGENWATESTTWKQFAKAVKDAMGQGNTQYGYTFQASSYEGLSCCDFNEFMTSWGGAYFGGRDTLFGPIGKRPVTIDQQPLIDSIRMIRTFIEGPDAPNTLSDYAGPISPRAVLAWIEDPSLAPLLNGEAIANRNWSYGIKQSVDSLGPEKVGVMPLPYAVTPQQSQYKGIGGPVAALGGWHNTINPHSDKLDKSVQVIQAMSTQRFQLGYFELLARIPPQPSTLSSKQAKQVPVIGNYVEQLRIAGENAIPRPVTVVWPQQSTKIAQLVNSAYAGGIAPEQAMASLQTQITEIENFNQ